MQPLAICVNDTSRITGDNDNDYDQYDYNDHHDSDHDDADHHDGYGYGDDRNDSNDSNSKDVSIT